MLATRPQGHNATQFIVKSETGFSSRCSHVKAGNWQFRHSKPNKVFAPQLSPQNATKAVGNCRFRYAKSDGPKIPAVIRKFANKNLSNKKSTARNVTCRITPPVAPAAAKRRVGAFRCRVFEFSILFQSLLFVPYRWIKIHAMGFELWDVKCN